MSSFANGKALNREGRAFALASGFGSAMGSGMAVASASTSAYMDGLKIQAARGGRSIRPPTVLRNRSFQANPSVVNNQARFLQPMTQSVRTAPVATVASSAAVLPLNGNYSVPDNVDPNPIVMRKKPNTPVNYTQLVSVKFLQPPPPQQPGDIVITQQKDVQAAPVAPKLIRQKAPLPVKPAPLVVREQPPLAPAPIPPEHHVIPGKVIPPPPRKVVIERLPQLPQPPQDLIVERWLEYGPRARRVVFRPAPPLIPAPPPKNVLIQWDSPNVALNRQFRNLGIAPASPAQYMATFGASLVPASAVPDVSRGIRPTNGARLAAENPPYPVKLVGDVDALSLINRAGNQQLASPSLFGSAYAVASTPAIIGGSALAQGSSLATSYSTAIPPAISYRSNSVQPTRSILANNNNNYLANNRSYQGSVIQSRGPVNSAVQNPRTINYRSNSIAPTRSILVNRANQSRPMTHGSAQAISYRSNSVLPTRSILPNNNNSNLARPSLANARPNRFSQAMSYGSNTALPPRRSILANNNNNINLARPSLANARPNQYAQPLSYRANSVLPPTRGPFANNNNSRPLPPRQNLARPASSFRALPPPPQRSQSVMSSRNFGPASRANPRY
jgi:hypothetical protein